MKLSFFDTKSDLEKAVPADNPVAREGNGASHKTSDDSQAFSYQAPTDEKEFSRDYLNLKVELHQKVIDRINLAALEDTDKNQIYEQISGLIKALLAEE